MNIWSPGKMAVDVCFLVFVISVFSHFLLVLCVDTPHKRFEYKYSFKGPYLAQKDGTVPFWEYDGNAIASEEMIRITPSLRSKKGSVWTKNRTNFDWWEVELVFRVNGRGRVGADGLAFWYTDRRGTEGGVFGSNDKWVGLGIFFDSFDNDGRNNNPYIMAMTNDGTKVYDHQSDGANQQLSGCLRDFRNKPFPVRAKIEYYRNVLTVSFHGGNTNNDEDYEMCLRVENVYLPQYGFFGVSAATGGLADDHDVLKLLTHSLRPQGTEAVQTIADSEKEKFSKEYEEYKEKLEKQKEEYRKLHPEEARLREMEMNPEGEFESQQQRELQQIFQGQGQIFEFVKALHRKLDEVIGRQERTLSLLSAVQMGGVPAQVPHGQGVPPPVGTDSIRRHEVEALLGNQREVVQTARDIKSFVAEIHQKTSSLTSGQKPSGAQVFDSQAILHEVRDGLNVVKRDVSTLHAKSQGGGCPPAAEANCLTPAYFFLFMGVQLAVLIGYMMYRSSKEAQAKKFY